MDEALCCELSSVAPARECDNFKMCMHSHFQPLLGIDLKWWLHECTTADHVIFLWDEDFREPKGRQKGVHRPQAGNVKLWTIICWAKYNACQMNWSTTPKTQQLPHQNTTEKSSVWRRVCVCAQPCCSVLVSLSLPSFSHTQTLMHYQITASPTVFFLKESVAKKEEYRLLSAMSYATFYFKWGETSLWSFFQSFG